jgi:hypothetical protein
MSLPQATFSSGFPSILSSCIVYLVPVMRIRRSSTDRINNASIAVSRRRPKSGSTSAGPKCRTRVKASVAPNGFPVT